MGGSDTIGEQVILEEVLDDDYEPSEEEVAEYAQWLGMDLEREKDLIWIAREGLKAPLPKEWKPCKNEDGELYYFNFKTQESTWDHPCDKYYKELYQKEKIRQLVEGQKPGAMKNQESGKTSLEAQGRPHRLQPLVPQTSPSTPAFASTAHKLGFPQTPLHWPVTSPQLHSGQGVHAKGLSPLSGTTSSTSSTTPSSIIDWRKGEEQRGETSRLEFLRRMDERKQSWMAEQEAKFEDWKQQMRLEYEQKQHDIEESLQQDLAEKQLEVEHEKKLLDVQTEFAKPEGVLIAKNERGEKQSEDECKRIMDELESASKNTTERQQNQDQKDEESYNSKRDALAAQQAADFQCWQHELEDDYEQRRRGIEAKFQQMEEMLQSEKEQHLAEISTMCRNEEDEMKAANKSRLRELKNNLEAEQKQLEQEMAGQLADLRKQLTEENRRELEFLKKQLDEEFEQKLSQLSNRQFHNPEVDEALLAERTGSSSMEDGKKVNDDAMKKEDLDRPAAGDHFEAEQAEAESVTSDEGDDEQTESDDANLKLEQESMVKNPLEIDCPQEMDCTLGRGTPNEGVHIFTKAVNQMQASMVQAIDQGRLEKQAKADGQSLPEEDGKEAREAQACMQEQFMEYDRHLEVQHNHSEAQKQGGQQWEGCNQKESLTGNGGGPCLVPRADLQQSQTQFRMPGGSSEVFMDQHNSIHDHPGADDAALCPQSTVAPGPEIHPKHGTISKECADRASHAEVGIQTGLVSQPTDGCSAGIDRLVAALENALRPFPHLLGVEGWTSVERATVSAVRQELLLHLPHIAMDVRKEVELIIQRHINNSFQSQLCQLFRETLRCVREPGAEYKDAQQCASSTRHRNELLHSEQCKTHVSQGPCTGSGRQSTLKRRGNNPSHFSCRLCGTNCQTCNAIFCCCCNRRLQPTMGIKMPKRHKRMGNYGKHPGKRCGPSCLPQQLSSHLPLKCWVKNAEPITQLLRMQRWAIRKRRAMLESIRSMWISNWQALADEPSVAARRMRQAILHDVWRALEGQAQGLNTDVRVMQGMQSRIAPLLITLKGGHSFGHMEKDQEIRWRDPQGTVFRPVGCCHSRSVEDLNKALETALEAIEREQRATQGSDKEILS